MFTGIVQTTCKVVDIQKKEGVTTLAIHMPASLREGLVTGASVANNGVCLTVTQIDDDRVFFDVMEETLAVTNLSNLAVCDQVNIERSLKFGTEIGGHILSGHIQTMATVVEISSTAQHYNLKLQVEPQWMDYIFYKGFIGVNGCSLTVGELSDSGFMLHLIPETLRLTNLGQYKVGDKVNIEIDSQTQVIVDTVTKILAKKAL